MLAGLAALRGLPVREAVDSGVALAAAAVPEGLPLLATAAQLSAARRLAEKGALVRLRRAVEALGRVDIACVDKTGTRPSPEQLLREGPEASLGGPLLRDIALRATVTAAGATGAWLAARGTGTRAHASTVAITALVGAQLGQTLLVGGRDPVVLAVSLGSAAFLAGVVSSHRSFARPTSPRSDETAPDWLPLPQASGLLHAKGDPSRVGVAVGGHGQHRRDRAGVVVDGVGVVAGVPRSMARVGRAPEDLVG